MEEESEEFSLALRGKAGSCCEGTGAVVDCTLSVQKPETATEDQSSGIES